VEEGVPEVLEAVVEVKGFPVPKELAV